MSEAAIGSGDGETLVGGRYLLAELLGVGGTGSVFAAEDITAGGARVAVKLLHPHLCRDEASREVFLREARLATGIVHENVVRVHGAGMHDAGGLEMPWIAMDLVRGSTLREHVDTAGPLGLSESLSVAEGVLAGLQAAHDVGVVHRDISPQNVILDRAEGVALTASMVRIVDFGLADLAGRTTRGDDVLLTRTGPSAGVIGNASYMSPEQAQGLPVRAVSDLYQVGAVLVFAVTGDPPFPRETTAQVMRAHISAPPPVISAIVPTARQLDRIVTRAMAKTPAKRFRDAAEFRAAVVSAQEVIRTADGRADEGTGDGEQMVGFGHDPDARAEAVTRTLVLSSDAAEPLSYLSPGAALPHADAPAPRASSGAAAAVIAGALILGLAVWGVASATGTPDVVVASPSAAPPATPQAPSTVPSPVMEPVPESVVPQEVQVPRLSGTLNDAEAALAVSGLTLGSVTRVESAHPADQVLSQLPEGGTAPAGSAVDVTIASGDNVVPQLSGLSFAAASALLSSSGFDVTADRADASPTTIVVRSEPGAGAVLRLGVTIALVLSAPTPAPTETTDPGVIDEEPLP